MTTEGVLFVATGSRHLAEAETNARASRPHLGGRPIAILTDDLDAATASRAFDVVLPHPDARRSYRDKIPGLVDPPFDRTLFLDTDARIVQAVDGMFPMLDRHDVMAAQSPVRLPDGWRDRTIPEAFPELNTGVLLIRRGPDQRTAIERWLAAYDRVGQDWDQATFRSAIWASIPEGLRLGILPPEANLRTTKPWIAGKGVAVTVVHGRIPSEEWPALTEYLNDDVDRFRTSEEWRTRHPQSGVSLRVAPSRRGRTASTGLAATFAAIDRRGLAGEDEPLPCENPVFVLSAGGRSDSMRLRRMLLHDPNLMVWGEPHDRARIVQSIADQWRPFTESWPTESPRTPLDVEAPLEEGRITSGSRAVADLRQAHRLFLDRLYGAPARAAGRDRWGLEEVRLDADHLACLRWLFPGARFILLVRNPFDAYASDKSSGAWYLDWPEHLVEDATTFGRHWSRLACQFHALAADAACQLVRYEDLTDEAPAVRRHAGLSAIGSPDELASERRPELGLFERRRLAAATKSGRRLLGY